MPTTRRAEKVAQLAGKAPSPPLALPSTNRKGRKKADKGKGATRDLQATAQDDQNASTSQGGTSTQVQTLTSNVAGSNSSQAATSVSTGLADPPKPSGDIANVIPPLIAATFIQGNRSRSPAQNPVTNLPVIGHRAINPLISKSSAPPPPPSAQDPSLSPNSFHTPSLGRDPDSDPSSDSDSDSDSIMLSPRTRSFQAVFVNQVLAALGHLCSRQGQWAGVGGFMLLVCQVCSAGRLCYDDEHWCIYNVFNTISPTLDRYFWSYLCLLSANTLTILGISDLTLGIVRSWQRIGTQRAMRWSDGQRITTLNIICDETTEPFLMLVLTFGLRDLPIFSRPPWFGEVSNPIRLFCNSGCLHLMKWLLQTIEILEDMSAQLRLRRPLVFGFFWALLPICVWLHLCTISEDTAIAGQFLNVGKWSLYGLVERLIVGKCVKGKAQALGVNMLQVTHKVVTQWVQPTTLAGAGVPENLAGSR